MKSLLFFFLAALVSFSTPSLSSAADPERIEKLKQAFREGFLSERVTGREIYKVMSEKYDEKPLLYVQYLHSIWLRKTGPILYVELSKKDDDLGRLVIVPKVQFSDIEPQKFQNAFWLMSIISWRKDFQDLTVLEQKLDEKMKGEESLSLQPVRSLKLE